MDKVSRFLYVIAGIVNAVVEVFATLTLLCALDPYTGWALTEKMPWLGVSSTVNEVDGGTGITTISLTVILLLFSFVLYILGTKGRKNLKNHTHRLPSHIFTMIISFYYFAMGFTYISVLSSSAFIVYTLIGAAVAYFLAGLTGVIGHNK